MKSRAILLAATLLAATPASAAIVTYAWTGGGTSGPNVSQQSYYKYDLLTNTYLIAPHSKYGITGSGTFSFDTANLPPNTGPWPYSAYSGAGWLVATTNLDDPLLAATPTTSGAFASVIWFNNPPYEWNTVFVSDNTAQVSTINGDGSITTNSNEASNNLYNFTALDTFVVDGITLPWLFDLRVTYAASFNTIAYQTVASDGFFISDAIEERWASYFHVTDLKVFVDGVQVIDGIIGGPPVNNVPEPAALALFGLGLAGFGLTRRRRR